MKIFNKNNKEFMVEFISKYTIDDEFCKNMTSEEELQYYRNSSEQLKGLFNIDFKKIFFACFGLFILLFYFYRRFFMARASFILHPFIDFFTYIELAIFLLISLFFTVFYLEKIVDVSFFPELKNKYILFLIYIFSIFFRYIKLCLHELHSLLATLNFIGNNTRSFVYFIYKCKEIELPKKLSKKMYGLFSDFCYFFLLFISVYLPYMFVIIALSIDIILKHQINYIYISLFLLVIPVIINIFTYSLEKYCLVIYYDLRKELKVDSKNGAKTIYVLANNDNLSEEQQNLKFNIIFEGLQVVLSMRAFILYFEELKEKHKKYSYFLLFLGFTTNLIYLLYFYGFNVTF